VRRRTLIVCCLIVGASIALAKGWLSLPPISSVYDRPSSEVEAYLLTKTPLGSTRGQVHIWLATQPHVGTGTENASGDSLVEVHRSTGLALFTAYVYATYKFDNHDRLTSARVTRGVDGL